MPFDNNTAPGMPVEAPHAVKCENGGKHTPTTKEKKVEGQHIKYRVCTKCGKMPNN